MRSLSGFYDVDSDGTVIRCRARGKLRYQKQKPLVGDRVQITRLSDAEGVLDAVLPRTNAFERPAVANIEQMLIVASGAIPVTDPFLVDRMTALAISRGCVPVIVWNKWDLAPKEDMVSLYRNAGFCVIPCSAATGLGIEEIRAVMSGKISAFTGNSGVGKSSIINALDTDACIPTGEISVKLGRGRHTTRHVELFRLSDDILIADTPGFAAFEDQPVQMRNPVELVHDFPDFAPYLNECDYADCAHIKEKGCRLLQAVGEGKVSKSRHDSYVRLYELAKESYRPWESREKGGRS